VERRSLINDDLSVGQEELFTYDSLGRPEVLTDALGAATSVYLPRSGILDYGLLADGRYKRAHQYFDASTHPVTSANYMRLREVAYQRIAGGASSPLSASTYDYRVDGLIKQFDRSVSGQGMQETSYLYNSHGRLAESSASGLTNQYRYSKSGDLIRMDTKGAVKTFTEGLGGQVRYARAASDAGVLRGSVDEYATVEVDGRPTVLRGDLSFEAPLTGLDSASALTITAEDISNNLRTSTYQVSTNGVIREYSYDRNGRLERQTAAGAEMVYEWDAADRLLAIQTAKSPVAGTKRTEFIYDVLDQRTGIIEKAFDGANWATTAHDTFVWADGELVQKRDATGSIIRRRYLRDGFIDVDTAGVGRGYIVTRDHLGSAREVVEVDTGVVVARYDYDAFGTPTRQGSVHEDRLFSGHYYHASSGLHLAWARAYDSTNGRWLSRDPLIWAEALPEGTSAYAYVGNDPVNRVDPLGLCFQSAKSRPPSRPAASQQDFTHGFVIPGDADAGLLAGFLRNNGRNSERALYYLNEIWNQRNAMNSAAGKGSEVVRSFDSFNAARSAARKAAGLGDDVVPFVSEIGPLKGRVTGMMSSDGLKGWRLDYDKGKGFHVNWWNRTAGPNRAQWSYGANHVLGKSHDDFLNLLEHAFPK
jgi:RHS repeat-associated protein